MEIEGKKVFTHEENPCSHQKCCFCLSCGLPTLKIFRNQLKPEYAEKANGDHQQKL